MLKAKIEQNGKVREEKIFVIDCHSHLGKDIDGAIMMNPMAPSGTFDFWESVQGKLSAELSKTNELSFSTNLDGRPAKISWSFETFSFTDSLYGALNSLKGRFSDLKEKSRSNQFIDQAVCFPFQDEFRGKDPEALYRASNVNISRFTTRFPFSMKLIGYARCDPMEGRKAVNEVKHAREVLGLRGLKLHPRSEGWIDNIKSEKVIDVLIEAARHSMPIIFDTRGKGSIMAIGELIKSTRNLLQSKHPELLPHFKVIIAHFAQGNIGDHEVYNTIVQPNTYGDLSMLHGEGAGNFFKDFRAWFNANGKQTVDNREWSEYLIFGSDYPYFGDVHASKLIIYVVNKLFFDSGGNLQDVKNILGLNQIRILPEYGLKQKYNNISQLPSTIISNIQERGKKAISTRNMAIMALAKLITDDKIDIRKICVQFDKSWNDISRDIMLTVSSIAKGQNIDLLLMDLIKDSISLLA
ncbi:MAG: amidohydrolase family protein, partial [Promethearchaeota archaeon]